MKSVSVQFGAAENQSRVRRTADWNVALDSPTVMTGLLVFIGYYLGAKLGFALTFQPHPVSVLWPPNSILVAALLLTPPRIWWFILLAAFPAHWAAQLQSHVPPLMILCWFISNSCEALIGASLTRYLVGGPIRFSSLRSAGFFCLCVALVGPFLSSFLDAAFVVWNHWGQGTYWELIRIRLVSNVLAALTVVPLIVTWATDGILALRTVGRARYLEACLLLLSLLSVSFAVFYKLGSEADPVFLFLPLPLLLWAAVRFGVLGTSTAMAIVGFLTIWSASYGHGPFSGGTPEQNALAIQIFLIVLSIPMLLLATVIEERATREMELRESEARINLAAKAANLGLWLWNIPGDELWVTEKWKSLFGFADSKSVTFDRLLQVVHPGDRERMKQLVQHMFEYGGEYESEYRITRPDGSIRWIAGHGSVDLDERGKPAFARGVSRDITKRKMAEEELRESEERMSLAVDAANLGLWEWNVSKDELWGTPARRALLGLPASGKIKLEDGLSKVHVDDRDRVRQTFMDAVKTGKNYHVEYRVVLPDGSVRWTDHRGRCVRGADGKDLVLRGVSMDVTAQKQSRELFRMATEASPSGIVVIDNQGRIVLVNSHIEELFGYNREELLGKRVEILVPERFASQHPEHRARFLAAPTARAMGAGRELFGRRKDGSEFPVEIGLSPIQTPEGMLVLAAVVDISARKLAEAEAIQHREEVGHLGRVAVMGELAASIAHELNQPLSGIISNASAGQRFIDRGNVDLRELRELLGDVIADGRRAGEVIRGIRNMVKKGSRVRQRVSLNHLITNVVRMVKSDAMLRSCDLDALLEPDLPSIEGDPIQLQQVLLNLIVNAFDAMRDTPLSQRKVVIATERNGNDAIRTSVRDYGTGIPAEARDRLFDHFFTTKAWGLGMGLAIVRSIVESHSGTIAGENAEGGGARFHFILPVSRERAAHSAI